MLNNDDNLASVFIALRSRLMRAVARIVPAKEIEDIVQETYVRVCQIDNQNDIRHPRSLLLKTARNLAFDYLKKAETRLTDDIEPGEDDDFFWSRTADETFEQVASNQEFARFCEAVRLLPVQCRKAFILKKVYGHTQKEIARELGLSESTVEKHIAQGVKRCMLFMENDGTKSTGAAVPQRMGSTRPSVMTVKSEKKNRKQGNGNSRGDGS